MNREISGIVFDLKRYALHDGPGIRVTVHMKGCPLSCLWCHNPESKMFEPRPLFRKERCIACGACVGACPNGAVAPPDEGFETDFSACSGAGDCVDVCPSGARELCGKEMKVSDVMREVLKERVFFEQSGGGVTVSGGEPLSQPEFVTGFLMACKKEGLRTALDTSGFASPSVLLSTVPFTDLYLYDVKIMDSGKHRQYAGVDNEIILSNLLKLSEIGARIWARMPVIPGVNSDETNLRETGKFLSLVRGVEQLNLLPYHSSAEDKHNRWRMDYTLSGTHPPTEQSMRRAVEIIEDCGVKAIIGG